MMPSDRDEVRAGLPPDEGDAMAVDSGAPAGASPGMVTAPTGNSLQRLAEAAWERTGDASRLVFEGREWTGAELALRTRRLSHGLRTAGLEPGDRVVVMMANCPEVGVTYGATWRAGGVVTPVLFLLSEPELRHVLSDGGAALAVTTPEFLPKVVAAAAGVDTLRAILVAGGDAATLAAAGAEAGRPVLDLAELEAGPEGHLVDVDPASPGALLYTGGTTGRSKGVVLSHDALSASAWGAVTTTVNGTDSGADEVLLLPLPLSHVYGLMINVAGMHTPTGRRSVLMRWFDAAGFLELVQRHRVTSTSVVPSMIQLLLQQPLEDYDLGSLRRVGSGAAPLPREVAEEFVRRVPGAQVGEGYGCTETAGLISASPLDRYRSGSVGMPAAGMTVRIERPDGTEAATGEDGEITVRGAGVMTGYWNAPEETARALRGGWLHTGDVGHLDEDGYLYVVDRIKDLVIRGGFNVYPRDVEEAMLAHPDVVAAAVVGRPDPTLGEEVVAYVQLRPGADAGPADLVAHGKALLSAAKYPREVHVLDAVPLTSVGKLDRKALRQRARQAGDSTTVDAGGGLRSTDP
jgi:long-chain acyl-CoA synthetase